MAGPAPAPLLTARGSCASNEQATCRRAAVSGEPVPPLRSASALRPHEHQRFHPLPAGPGEVSAPASPRMPVLPTQGRIVNCCTAVSERRPGTRSELQPGFHQRWIVRLAPRNADEPPPGEHLPRLLDALEQLPFARGEAVILDQDLPDPAAMPVVGRVIEDAPELHALHSRTPDREGQKTSTSCDTRPPPRR